MDHIGCEEYLAWRRERLVHQHARLTRTIRDSGIVLFISVGLLAVGAYRVYDGIDQISKAAMYAGLAVGLIAMVAMIAQLDARTRRQDTQEELDVLDSLPMFQPEPLYRLPTERETFPAWEQPSA